VKIEKVSLENYRFFQTKQEFSFESKNILLYGENGSGKSSLFNGIQKFFKYYQDIAKSKISIKEAQNIFVNKEQKPKITIQIDAKNITFDENGFTDDALKIAIENTGKSKLFLTYKDIYNINAIFQDDITYKEFKNIFVTLYHKELFHLFEEFEKNNENIIENIIVNKNILLFYISELKKELNDFYIDYESAFEPNIALDEEDKEIIDVYDIAYYLSDNSFLQIAETIDFLKIYLDFDNKIDEIQREDIENILIELDKIFEDLKQFTLSEDRYINKEESRELVIHEKEVIDNFFLTDELESIIEQMNYLFILSKSYSLAQAINKTIHGKLNSFIDKINEILKFLQTNLEIKNVSFREYILFSQDFLHKKEVYNIDFEIEYAGKKLDNHSQNLNEAKMSALNSAIYFSSVLEKKPDIPVLVLDDLMISLDMSNRDKMLDFLLDKSNFDESYQILIFTHDRAFFEMAKRKLDRRELGKWKYFEMFLDIEEKDGSLEELPFVKEFKQPYGYVELAEQHLKKREYPPTANYLRKEVERLLDEHLGLDHLENKFALAKLKNNNKYIREFSKELKTIITILEQFNNCEKMPDDKKAEKCNLFAQQVVGWFNLYKNCIDDFTIEENSLLDKVHFVLKDILHPQSHHDLTKPLYKKELEEALAILKVFKEQVDAIDLCNLSDEEIKIEEGEK
jgi:ABC-type lipoprotein export system ATPase subunit